MNDLIRVHEKRWDGNSYRVIFVVYLRVVFLVVMISLLVEDNDCHYQMIIQCTCNYMATVVCVQCTYKHA